MRIGLNLLHALPEIGGGWNYIENLIAALGEHSESTHSFVAFVNPHSASLAPTQPHFKKVLINLQPESRIQRVLFENTVLQRLALEHGLDCLHWFANVQAGINMVPAVVTVYDLQPYHGHASYSWAKRVFLHRMFTLTVRRATMLLPMSQATADDLCKLMQADPARITVIPPVLEAHFRPATQEQVSAFRVRHQLPHEFWLYVAHFYNHKNHVRLLQAYKQLKGSGLRPWPLVLRGDDSHSSGEVREALVRLELTGDVIFLPRLQRLDMAILYSAASGLVFPSLYEGAGIPVIEAMACGCPVIGSSVPAIREFAAEAASYFDPMDVEAISQALFQFQSDPTKRERHRQLGLSRARDFDAASVVGRLLAAYERAAR